MAHVQLKLTLSAHSAMKDRYLRQLHVPYVISHLSRPEGTSET